MEFRILGPLEAVSSGRRIRIVGTRQQRLLGLLLLDIDRVVPVDRLINDLWESPPSSARQQVHNSIRGLRACLDDGRERSAIGWTEAGYRLDIPGASLDAHIFHGHVVTAGRAADQGDLAGAIEALGAGLDLWRGHPLAGLAGAAFENAATKLAERRLAAVEDLMDLRTRAGDAAAVVGDLYQLVAEHPLRESLRVTLMRALHMTGRQADALTVFDQGRRMLTDELGLDPSPTLLRAHAEVLTSAPATAPRPSDATPPSAKPPDSTAQARSYLPRDTPDFSGRSAELLKMLGEARGASPTAALTISAVDGMGGVGKTTLAIHFGHQVAAEHPDGHYFVDLRGFTSGAEPRTAEQALDELLRDSGLPPELVPATVESKSAAWRSRVAGKRILLILDNAGDAAHVRSLLPGSAGALVVITSRRKLTALEGAHTVSLDVLPQEDAVTLFENVTGAERVRGEADAVAEAVRLCGHLPLAIRIAAARLRDRTSWNVADLVDRLADGTRRARFLRVDDRCVMTALKVSYRYLTPEQQRLFRLLSLHPGPDIDAQIAAALADIEVDRAEEHLDALFDANLVKQRTTSTFFFHDLILDCARELLDEFESDEGLDRAAGRLLDYFLHKAHSLSAGLKNLVYEAEPQVDRVPEWTNVAASTAEAVDALNDEHDNLVAATRFAIDRGMHRQGWQLDCTLQPLLQIRNYGGAAYDLFRDGADAARAAGDLRGESACLRGLTAVCRYRRSTTEARTHLRRSLELTKRVGDERGEVAQLVQLGNLYLYEDDFVEARRIFLAAEPLTERDPTGYLRAGVTNNLGAIARDLGDYDRALEYLERAAALHGAEDWDSKASTLWGIGLVLHLKGEHDQALRTFSDGMRLSRENKLNRGEALCGVGLATVNRALGNLDQSIEQGRQALVIARRLDLRATECEALNSLGETALAMRDTDRAEQVFEQALVRARDYRFARYAGRSLDGLAHVAMSRGRHGAARRQWETAVATYPRDFAEARGARHHLASTDDPPTTCFRCDTPALGTPDHR